MFLFCLKNVSLNIKINKIYGKGIGKFLNIPFKYHKHELSESMRGKDTDNNEPQGGNIRGSLKCLLKLCKNHYEKETICISRVESSLITSNNISISLML